MPGSAQERARALVYGDGEWVVPPTRDAATVCLLRDGAAGLEVFLMRRPSSMRFAAGMYVFPGGAVEQPDVDTPFVAGADFAALARRGATAAPRALVSAAVRETFEECGVLLAVGPDGGWAPAHEALARDREALDEGRLGLADLLELRGLVIDPARLPLFGHWITPEVEPHRYDTRFFAAALPDGQVAGEVGGESAGSGWWAPTVALDQVDAGELGMLPPTIATLRWLAGHDAVAAALTAARDTTVRPLLPSPRADGAGGIAWGMVDGRTGAELQEADTSVTAAQPPGRPGG